MTLPRTLSVGRRLSLGAAAAILLLAALVGFVRWSMDRAAEAQAEATQKMALLQASEEISRRLGLSCTRFPWTAICPTGDRHDEVQHERNRKR